MSSSLPKRGVSRPGPSEACENGPLLQGSSSFSNQLVSFPPPRNPLVSIPDPSQQIRPASGAPALHSSAKRARGASPLSATKTPPNTRKVPRVSSSRNAVDTTLGPPACFELEEDPSFWRDQNVQVLIRIRPAGSAKDGMLENGRCVRQESSKTLTWTGNPETRFTFDGIACESTPQEKLFMAVGLPMVENCLSGYNSCMFAYGQTGSGKTYTMMGEIPGGNNCLRKGSGMIPRIFEYLFTRIKEEENNIRNDKLKCNCKCSFLEIHNEQITDLLDHSVTNLQLREDVKKGVHVENLREFEVNSINDVTELLLQGTANRKVAATYANSESSRSHCLFTCTIESQWEKDNVKHIRYSRLHLVDLAGSERQRSSQVEGERLKEAANINKSLSTLSLVIMTLVDVASGKQRHIPYRNSKLTFLLQDSLGGNSKTIIIANINPSVGSANETLSTLKFAKRAKLIQNNAKVNEDASCDVVALQRQIQMLKDQLTFLIKSQDICGSPGINTAITGMADNENFQYIHQYSSIVSHTKPVNLNSKMEEADAILKSALRREKIAGDTIRSLQAEIEYMNYLISERENDAQHAKTISRLQEEKIKRLELLASGLLSAENYLVKENNSLSKENLLLREKINGNLQVTHFALENVRLLNQLRKFVEFNQKGKREMLLEEISNLRNQLLNVFESQWHAGCSLKELNEDVPVNQDQLHSSHTMTPQNECDDLEVVDNFRKRLDASVKPNIREVKEWCCNLKEYITSSEEANAQDMDVENTKSNGKRFPDDIVMLANDPEDKDEKLVKSSAKNVHAKLAKMQSDDVKARILSGRQYHYATQTSPQLDSEAVKHQINKVTANSICYFQAEKDLQEKLEHINRENSRLLELISAKEAKLSSDASGWEKAIVCLTSFLVDGCQSLDDASEQVKHIMDSLPERNACVGEQFERAMKAFVDKEILIFNLQRSLENAQAVGLDMMSKVETLRQHLL